MKKLKYILILSLFAVSLLVIPNALAVNDVTLTADMNIDLTSPAMTLVLADGSEYSSMTVTASTISFTISPGGSITITSSDRYSLSNDQPMNAANTCSSSLSQVTFAVSSSDSDDQTIIFNPTTSLCSGGGSSSTSSGGGGQSGSGSSSSSAKAPAGTVAVSKTVMGSSGGTVTTTDKRAGVTTPGGLTSGNLSMLVTPKDASSYTAPAGGYAAVAGQVYNFRLTSEGTDLTDFSSPVTIAFTYTGADIIGLDENSLRIYYQSDNGWILVGGTVDKVNQIITAEVDHFTIFGVFGAKTSSHISGDLIKLECSTNVGVNDPCRSVYYLGSDSKRYVFPNQTTYNSWYADFSNVKIVSGETMASYPIGGNVTIRPGTYLVKVTTDPKVYAVEPGGILRWVDSETTAKKLYGNDWAKKIVDVTDAFFVNYNASTAVNNKVSIYYPIGTLVKYAGSDNIYYVTSNNIKRLFSNAKVLSDNGFNQKFIVETDIVYENGANIVGVESALNTTAGL